METENSDKSLISAIKKSSSWPIIRGSLDDAITCDSCDSAVESLSNSNSNSNSDQSVHSTSKSPLFLRRPSPDSAPCELTILFPQQHEIKQVYVRSTARVYEIYCANDEKGGNEYLCTVRCGAAAGIEELLQESDGVGSLSTSSSSSNRSSQEGDIRSESGGSANEDGWVDVKVQTSSILSKKDEGFMERGNQDCFEATAEISDADPVMSITLRLLSIQTGEYICIDEVYVFADPVVPAYTGPSTVPQGTSSESAAMSLLIPTLLQLSKSQRNRAQEQSDSAVGERKLQDSEHESIGATMRSYTSHSESMQSTMLNGASPHMSQPDFPVQGLGSHNNPNSMSKWNDVPCSRIERTLDELVSRVAKIELFCSRFEENMLKPISNMEARLERVEQQVDWFVNTAKFPVTTCTKTTAPEFSCTESESNSILNGGNDAPGIIKFKPIQKDEGQLQDMSIPPLNADPSPCIQPDHVSSSTSNASQLLPSLVVTAPDFSCVDDEGGNDPFEVVKDSPKGSPNKVLSIDDALASALAGFLSSTSIDTDMVEETADISSEEASGETCLSESSQSDECVIPSVHVDGSNSTGKDIVVVEQESFVAANGFEETTESLDEHSLLFREHDSENPLGDSTCIEVDLDQVKTEISVSNMDGSKQTFVIDSSDSRASDTSGSTLGVREDNINSSFNEETAKECPGALLNVLKLQSPAIVDFGIPILDVKFSSQESFSAKSSLDTLLLDIPQLHSEVPCVEEDTAASFSEQDDLVMIENVDSAISENPKCQMFCLDNYDSGCMPPNREEEELQECKNRDTGASLI